MQNKSNWMSQLREDETPLSQLALVGTHDSGTYNYKSKLPLDADGKYVRCQNLTISQQLNSGARYIDIRVRRAYDTDTKKYRFSIFHGRAYCNLNMDDILSQVKSFLGSNSSETVIMSVKEDQLPASDYPSNGYNTRDLLNEIYIKPNSNLWYTGNDIPLYGNATKGKIVLMSRFVSNGLGLDMSKWIDNGITKTSKYVIQDFYKETGDTKINKIRQFFDAYCQQGKSNKYKLNFLSCSTLSHSPKNNAEYINRKVSNGLSNEAKGWSGIQILDFIGGGYGASEIVNLAIASNSRYFKPKS